MKKTLAIAVFAAGLTSLGVELAASRLLGNYFGASNLVWASIIGLILIYLTAGYFIGGSWADRSPKATTFFSILLWASLSVALIPVAARPLLRIASQAFDELQMGALVGSFVVVMILFIIPVTLLGTASPFAIRLSISDPEKAGKISGRIYAISTLGSFVGTFLPVLLLIPLLGTFRTFIVLGALLMLVALAGLGIETGTKRLWRFLWMPVILVLLWFFGLPGRDKVTTGLIYEDESAYNYIQVLEYDSLRMLRLNEGQGVHSVYHPDRLDFPGPWDKVLAAPFFNSAPYPVENISRAAIIGLAAGTTARQLTDAFGPGIQIDGIEIDPLVVQVGRDYFDMNEPNLNVIIQDGRWALSQLEHTYQIISIDAYRPPYIPWHMTTLEFFSEVRAHLAPDGVMVINIGRSPTDRQLIDALTATIQQVFPSVYITDLEQSFNSILFATVQPTTLENFRQNYLRLSSLEGTSPLILNAMALTYEGLQPVHAGDIIFTDDHAPVEWMTNAMIIDFLTSGQMETLQ